MKQWFRNNGLSIVFFALFLVSLGGQIASGLHEHNKQLQEEGAESVSLIRYLSSGHFF